MSETRSARDIVLSAHNAFFTLHDTDALPRYFSEDFIEHSSLLPTELAGRREMLANHPMLQHQTFRVLFDGEYVALHGRLSGFEKHALIGFDLYRVVQGKIVEHWDGLVPEAAPNVSGRTQFDGPTDPGKTGDKEKNRDFIRDYFTQTLIEADYSGFRRYTDGVHFIQHSPDIADGVEEVIDFLEHLRQAGTPLKYDRIHHMIAEGQFVLTHSEGSIGGERHVYFELWRIENGKLVEMWDAIAPVPTDDDAPHANGIF